MVVFFSLKCSHLLFVIKENRCFVDIFSLEVGEFASFCLLFLAVNHSKAGNELGLGVGLVLGLGIGQG